jgi:hypothetical protein
MRSWKFYAAITAIVIFVVGMLSWFIGGEIFIMWSGLQFVYPPAYAGFIWTIGLIIGIAIGVFSIVFNDAMHRRYGEGH